MIGVYGKGENFVLQTGGILAGKFRYRLSKSRKEYLVVYWAF
jgi:hypothetical protein